MTTGLLVAAGDAAATSAATMTPGEHQLLQRVADHERTFRNRDVHNLAEMERCDAEVRELQKLEQKGWIMLQWNHMTHHGELFAACPLITEKGRMALLQ